MLHRLIPTKPAPPSAARRGSRRPVPGQPQPPGGKAHRRRFPVAGGSRQHCPQARLSPTRSWCRKATRQSSHCIPWKVRPTSGSTGSIWWEMSRGSRRSRASSRRHGGSRSAYARDVISEASSTQCRPTYATWLRALLIPFCQEVRRREDRTHGRCRSPIPASRRFASAVDSGAKDSVGAMLGHDLGGDRAQFRAPGLSGGSAQGLYSTVSQARHVQRLEPSTYRVGGASATSRRCRCRRRPRATPIHGGRADGAHASGR